MSFGDVPSRGSLGAFIQSDGFVIGVTLSYDLEPWRKAQIQNPYKVNSTKDVCLWDAGAQAGPLICCTILTSHLTLNLSMGMDFLI